MHYREAPTFAFCRFTEENFSVTGNFDKRHANTSVSSDFKINDNSIEEMSRVQCLVDRHNSWLQRRFIRKERRQQQQITVDHGSMIYYVSA